MAYQTLYLKYRSQTFSDLVGQDAIARTLQNAVAEGRVAHAYLFSGVRGTGKTSTARILAKAINCLNRQGAEPCGQCAACLEIGSGAAVDLVEIDAASNRGIDEIRELRERVKYLPASLKMKVYIIDEAHMLTPEAFNALLKTLEEPPAHVLFVLATTEPHKIPLTVASRCQRFDFRRIDTPTIARRLAWIVEREGHTAEPAAVALIADLARGSMRDAITILDQLMGQSSSGALGLVSVRDLLGMADPALVVDLLGAATSGDGARTIALLQQFYDAGGDVRQLVRGLLASIRDAALLSVGANPSSDGSGRAALERVGRAAGRGKLLALWKGLMEMEPELRKGADARLLLEVTLLSAMSPVPSAEGDKPTVPAPVPSAVQGRALRSAGAGTEQVEGTVKPQPPEVEVVSTGGAGGIAAPSGPAPSPEISGVDPRWEALKQQLPRPVASLLSDARLAALSESTVRIEFTYKGQLDVMQRPDKKEVLLKAARTVFGPAVGIELVSSDKGAAGGAASLGTSSGAAASADRKAKLPLSEDPLVKEAINRFDAVNVRVTPGKGR